ncbi:hypothetical protein PR202_gb01114 [Eleusine coracana subsp. coracana]|uniref:Peroxisomal adenine nucleotide carrier 1 n=1 Tax=Eleusine coracana subsp. coracana TaxID=191504 RepID=A0AAV5DTK4_ELECO|nr:hypothetical protein PR202_gb01114 [Eleusine coracana subsp. coracana]
MLSDLKCIFRNLSDVFWEAVRKRQFVSLYQGLQTKNVHSFISSFIYFYGYNYYKRLYLEKSGAKSIGTTANLLVAAAAGASTVIVTQPLDTASSRMQTSAFGKSKGCVKLLQKYTAFDQLKQRLVKRQKRKIAESTEGSSPVVLSAFSAFLIGAIAKSIATVLTYPLIRCKTMIQAADDDDDDNEERPGKSRTPKTMLGALRAIWSKEGIPGFYKGLQAQILKTVLSSALLLMIKEKISKFTWVSLLALRRYLFVSPKRIKSA